MIDRTSSLRASLFLGIVSAFLVLAAPCSAGLKIYYLRHAEGGHNVYSAWKDKPKETWPKYVGNENMFTPKGEEQVAAVAARLAPYKFDYILCSPLWRTRNTILPYLQQNNLKAEIWPELQEVPFQSAKSPITTPSETLYEGGEAFSVPEKEQQHFFVRDGITRRIKISKVSEEQSKADIAALVKKNKEMLQKRWGGTDKSILIVGHWNMAHLFLQEFAGIHLKPRESLKNTGLMLLEEQPDGSFKLIHFNEQPYPIP